MSALLEVKHADISFGGIHAVKDLSFIVHAGEIVGLIGPNGSGKSPCVNLISGTYQLDAGEIWFDGKLIPKKMKAADRVPLGIGRTFQTPKPFGNMTVYDNILTCALRTRSFKEAHEKTREILALSGLDEYEEMISEKLPIEKRKLLDMARILTNNPKLIMMDEVMAGLNPIEMEESIRFVKKVNQMGIAILFIEHVMKAVVNVCTRAIVINEGSFLSEGVPKEVLKEPAVIAAYIGGKHHAET